MSKAKRCQRMYGESGSRRMCGRLLPKFSTSRYCPECAAKIESLEKRKKSVLVHGEQKIGYHDYGRKDECPNCGNKDAYVYIKGWAKYCMCDKCEGKEVKQ